MSKSRKRRSRELAEKLVKLGFKLDPEFNGLDPAQNRSAIKRMLVDAHVAEGVEWMTIFHSGGIYSWRFIVPNVSLSDFAATGMHRSLYEKVDDHSVMFKCATRHEVHLVLDYLEQLKIIAKS